MFRIFVALICLVAMAIYLLEYLLLQDFGKHHVPQKRPLRLSHLNILHTTDSHGWLSGHLNQQTYNADWGDFVSFSQHMRQRARDENFDLLLVDSGDRHDGNGLSDITSPNGARSLPIFARVEYDIITLGNHELYLWENSQQEVNLMIPHYGEKYVCSNVEYLSDKTGSGSGPGPGSFEPFGNRFRYFTTENQKLRVLAFAFLFDFNRAKERTRVTPIEQAVTQPWFKDVLRQFPPLEVDVVLVVGHVPVSKKWTELQLLHTSLRAAYPDTVIEYFGGHSHVRDFLVMDSKLAGLQSGRFCETVGFMSVDLSPSVKAVEDRFFRSYIDFSVDLFMFHSHKAPPHEFHTTKGSYVKHMIADARQDLGLDRVLGHVSVSNYYMDYVPLAHPKNIFRLLTERVLPTLPRNLASEAASERIIIINTGSVRYDLYKGPYTVDSHFIVSPFQNDWFKVRLPKHLALKLAPNLNEKEYILALEDKIHRPSNTLLKPPHHWIAKDEKTVFLRQNPLIYPDFDEETDSKRRLAKGYVTYDDFGHSGDDTPHRAVKNYPVPNVVQSLELKPWLEGDVDVIFYSFLVPNIRWAVEALGGSFEGLLFYSDRYLGLLLDDYVAQNAI